MPVDWRTLYCVMLATVLPMSASIRLFDALCRFVTWLAMSLLAAVSRLTEAPITPRCAETFVIAALIAVSAAWAVVVLVRLSFTPTAVRPSVVDESALMFVVI